VPVKESITKIEEKVEAWIPRTHEDYLIEKYLNKVGGIIFTEVGVGGHGRIRKWPPGELRRIDAVRIPNHPKEIVVFKRRVNGPRFNDLVIEGFEKKEGVEVIEAKRKLNRLVIGQSIVGADLLDLDYQPYSIKQVIIIETGDPLLEMICERRGIRVWNSKDQEFLF
jgi:hypothetical protein